MFEHFDALTGTALRCSKDYTVYPSFYFHICSGMAGCIVIIFQAVVGNHLAHYTHIFHVTLYNASASCLKLWLLLMLSLLLLGAWS